MGFRYEKGGVHAVGHALLAVVPLFLLCDSSDVDCEHARPLHNRPQPQRILVYDKRPGGVGVSDAMFGCHRYVRGLPLSLIIEGGPFKTSFTTDSQSKIRCFALDIFRSCA